MMRKSRGFSGTLLLGVLCLLVAAFGLSCASTRGTAPTQPQKQPFQPPSFEATAYASEEYGFSVHYPSDFAETEGGGLMSAASPSMVPRVDVGVSDVPEDASLEAMGEQVAAALGSLGGGEAEVVSSKETTLQDGVTPAQEFVVDWSFQGFPIKSIVLTAVQGGRLFNVTVTTGTAFWDEAVEQLTEIAYTLYFE